jgi:predicted nucleic acid-binding protein
MAQILVENLDPIILEKLETLAKQHPPTYDSLYLVLAITQQCQMVTAKDAKTPLRLCVSA